MTGYAVVDCETTGLNPARDRIIEIGIVLLDEFGEFTGEWNTLINPNRPVSAQFIHGISDDDVAGAPVFSSVVSDVAKELEGRAIVAHNAAFDVGFLNAEFARCGYPVRIPREASVCTMELSKIYLPAGSHSLVNATKRAGISLGGHHRAVVDAWGAADLLRFYLAGEAAGNRYAETAISRSGEITLPSAWDAAQNCAASLSWPRPLF